MKKQSFASLFLITLFLSSTAWPFPLNAVQSRIQTTQQQGRRPIAIFDLDETLMHSSKRKVMSYFAAINRNRMEFYTKYPVETRQLLERGEAVAYRDMMALVNQYDTKAWFARMGILNSAFQADADKAALPIYLSSEYMQLDSAYKGSQALLKYFYNARGVIYFVSSRYRSKQYDDTLQRLLKSGLYLNSSQSRIILREDGEASLDFKVRALNTIKVRSQNELGEVVLVAENETENLNAMMSLFPTAMPVFVQGAILNTSVALNPHPGVIKTKSFLADGQ